MKTSFFLSLLFSCFLLTARAQAPDTSSIQPAPADKAVVYFVRQSAVGLLINFSYFDSTKVIGRFAGPGYIRYECAPGKHVFWARSENKDFVEAELEAGKIYFLEAVVKMGAIKAAVGLEPVDPGNEKKMNRLLKIVEKKRAKSYTAEELATEESSLSDVIERGMSKYNTERSEGKLFPLLSKSMYYTKP